MFQISCLPTLERKKQNNLKTFQMMYDFPSSYLKVPKNFSNPQKCPCNAILLVENYFTEFFCVKMVGGGG